MGVGATVSRRVLLGGVAAAAAGGLAGCGSRALSPAADTATSTAGGDRTVALDALDDEAQGLALYNGLARRHPDLRARLLPAVEVQRRHIQALIDAVGGLASDGSDGTATDPLPDHAVPEAVASEAARLAASRLTGCRRVADGALASMLASMAAAHAVVAAQWEGER